MNNARWCAALLVGALALGVPGGCGGSDADGASGVQQQLAGCTQEGLVQLLLAFQNLDALVGAAAGGFAPEGATVVPSMDAADPPFTFDVLLPYFSGAGALPDQTLAGKVTFSDDPSAGFDAGDSADFSLAVTSQGGPWSGTIDGTYTVDSPTRISVDGIIDLDNADSGCGATFTLDPATPLVVVDTAAFSTRLAANFFGVEITGTIEALVQAGGRELDALITLAQGSQDAVVDGAIDGVPVGSFTLELLPPPEELEGLIQCFFAHSQVFLRVIEASAEVVEAIQDPQAFPDVTLTPTGPASFDFTVVNVSVLAGLGDSISGTLVAAVPPTPSTVTWTAALGTIGTTGRSLGAWSVVPPLLGQPGSASGAAEFSTPAEDCASSITMPASDPLGFAADGQLLSGRVVLEITQGDNTVQATFEPDAGEDGAFTQFLLNGIAIPADLLDLAD